MKRVEPSPLISRTLEVVEKKIGIQELCLRLGSPEHLIRAWLLGHASMPEYKFLRLVDLLTELDATWTDWDEAKPRQDPE